jgi:predicted phage terminase large subunit-like protein
VTWVFPSGASIRFAHLQHDKTVYDWQGAQVPLIGFDELTHFTEAQFWYMLSRNRDPAGLVRPYMRAATNPEPGWLADLLAWWINDDGYAIQERSGVVRYFVRYEGQVIWADTPEELADYPGTRPKSLTFIPARLQDNKILMARNPEYLANLMALPLIERERLLGGNWRIRPSGGKVFNESWFSLVRAEDVPGGGQECRYWDYAATEKQLKGDDPDYTAGVKIRKVGGTYYVMDCITVQSGPAEVDRLIVSTAGRDREQAARTGTRYAVRWEKQPAAAGKRDNRHLVQLLDGFDAAGMAPEGDKITRAKALSAQSEQGFVVLVAAAWNRQWLTHMHHQPDWDHDDIMDASAGAYNALANPVRVEWAPNPFYG